MIEIRWHGRGGQGAVTAAKILAESALAEGKQIQAFPEYGPERAGAPVKSFTRISEAPLYTHAQVTNPDVVVVLDATLMDAVDVTEGLKQDGVLLVNTNSSPAEIKEALAIKAQKVWTVDATGIALEKLKRNIPNTPMIGALIKATGIIKLKGVLEDFKNKFEKKFTPEILQGNLEAIQKAYEEVKGE